MEHTVFNADKMYTYILSLIHISFAAVLDDVEKALPEETFFRCHQSFLVNIDNIYQLDRTGRALILSN